MKELFIIAALVIFISCNSNKPSQKIIQPSEHENSYVIDNVQSAKFKKFITSIPAYDLPINLHCGLDSLKDFNNLHDFMEFIPKGMEEIYGYINSNNKFDLIMYGRVGDDLYPFLYSYDKNGKILDSLFLIINPCGQADETYRPNSYAFIDKNIQIIMIDTSQYTHYVDNQGCVIDSTCITNIKIRIDKSGHFKEISKETK